MRRLAVSFRGTAEEYGPLARRNLVLNVLLTGFYTPIAKRRAAEWFMGHTFVDGSPLERGAAAKSRWPAIVLVVIFVAMRIATDVGYGPPLPVVVIAGATLLPYLWSVTAARRVNGVRWRHVELAFTATTADVYRASWPLFVIAVPWAMLAPRVAAGTEGGEFDLPRELVAALVLLSLAAYPLLVRLAFNYRRLLVGRTCMRMTAGGEVAFARAPDGLCASWHVGFGEYLRLWLGSTVAFAASVFPVVLGLRYAMFGTLAAPTELTGWHAAAVPLAGALVAVIVSAPARAWHEGRMFRLLWNRISAGGHARFTCTLDVRQYARVRALTLLRWRGRAQAVIAAHRMKVESVALERLDGGVAVER